MPRYIDSFQFDGKWDCFFNFAFWSFTVSLLSGKESVYNAGDPGLIPGSGKSPGEGNGNPLQYSCMENPIDIGAWSDMAEYARMPRPFTKNWKGGLNKWIIMLWA